MWHVSSSSSKQKVEKIEKNIYEANSMPSCNRPLLPLVNLKVFSLLIVFLMMHITGKNYVKARNAAICDNHPHHQQQQQNRQQHSQQVDISDPPYLEYFMEHEVTEKEAKEIIYQIRADELDKQPHLWCERCTPAMRTYCMGPQFLRDHCCCDQRHEKGEVMRKGNLSSLVKTEKWIKLQPIGQLSHRVTVQYRAPVVCDRDVCVQVTARLNGEVQAHYQSELTLAM